MTIYCRLCAEEKVPNQIKSVITNEDITSKLLFCCEWIQQSTTVSSFQDVCKLCYQSLEKCWNFLKSVESAQEKLRWIQDGNTDYHMNIEQDHEYSDSEEPIHFPVQIKIDENFELEDEQQEEEITINQLGDDNEGFKWNEEMNRIDSEDEVDVKNILGEREQDNEDQQQSSEVEHGIESIFYCYLCSRLFGKFPLLKYHMIIHTTPKKYPCKYCHIRFRTKRQYRHHQKIHVDYFCLTCQKQFPSAYTLKVHNRMHTGSSFKLYGCVECDHYFTEGSAYYNHMQRRHGLLRKEAKKIVKYIEPNGDPMPYACNQCEKSFKSNDKLKRHVVIHSDNRPYKCKHCPRAFNDKYNMKYHQLRHSGIGTFGCSECDRKFSNRKTLLKHMERHMENCQKMFSCDSCEHVFKSSRGLKIHHRRSHIDPIQKEQLNCETNYEESVEVKIMKNTKVEEEEITTNQHKQQDVGQNSKEETQQTESPFYCYLCSKVFGKFPSLKYHMVIHTTPKQYPCNYCNLKFRTKRQYNHHEKIHVEYICSTCQKQFRSAFTLKVHSRMHTGSSVRLYGCVECDHYFTDVSAFYNHMKRKHGLDSEEAKKVARYVEPNGEPKPFVCDQCGKSFRANDRLRNHLLVHSDERPYKCKKCPKTFKNKYYMKEHELTHTGFKEFACDQCDRKFSRKNVLQRHMEIHTGVFRKTYSCDFCDRIFRSSYNLRNHRRTHTGEKPYRCDACSVNTTTESQLTRHCKSQTHLKRVSELMNLQEQDTHNSQF